MRRSSKDFRLRTGRIARRVGNMVRRVALAVSSTGGEWGWRGYQFPDLDGSGLVTEGDDDEPAPVFQGVLIYARPGDSDEAEGLLLQVGGEAGHTALAAVRDESARKRYVDEFGDIEQGEIAIFNSAGKARAIIQADGTIILEAPSGGEILARSKGGTAEALVKKSDFDGHTHAAGTLMDSTPAAVTGITGGASAATGTSVLKAE